MESIPLATPLFMWLLLGLENALDGLEVRCIEEKSPMPRSSEDTLGGR